MRIPYPYSYTFAPQLPPDPADSAGAASGQKSQAHDAADQAAVQAVAAETGVIGLWRAWRLTPDGAPWPPPKRVLVIEAAGDEPGLAARIAERLAEAGEADPQVEVCRTGFEWPAYTEMAVSGGELPWAAEPARKIQFAAVSDAIDADTGPSFHPGHLCLDEVEADKVAGYLYAGEPLLMTVSMMDDVLDSSQMCCVPMSFPH